MNESFYKQQTQPQLTGQKEPIPSHIGPYKVESLLSKGGMSFLYLGIDPATKKPLAIKTLPVLHAKDSEAISRFSKEAKIVGLTDHPSIVKLYGEGKWEGGFYIAMEWVQGISLRQFLIQHSFSLKRSLEIILQVAYALQHLHSLGVIHRDLKPENILIAENGEIKVIDFGIARLGEESLGTKGKTVLGTPYYMSPEQKENPEKITYSSDIYSLGVIAYELITGKPSFGMIELSFLPKELRKIIEKALAISPKERYQDIGEFIRDLSFYLHSEDFLKEKSEQDQIKEHIELFQKTSVTLFPPTIPPWSFADIGIAKTTSATHFGLYYDLFKISSDHYFFFMASPLEQGLDPLFAAATLRGKVQAFMSYFFKPGIGNFSPLTFLEFLNEQASSDPLIKKFAISYLYLDASKDQLSFFNAGLSSLIHISARGSSRVLHNEHSLLSENTLAEFSEAVDGWNAGDILVYHSFFTEIPPLTRRHIEREKELSFVAEELSFLSPQAQAEHLIKSPKTHALLTNPKDSHVVICIQRLA